MTDHRPTAPPLFGQATPPGAADVTSSPLDRLDRLDQLTAEAVERAREADDGDEPAKRRMRTSVEALCVEAHTRGLRVEQLLILLKQRWNAVPGPRTNTSRLTGPQRLGRLVETCIRVYFGDR